MVSIGSPRFTICEPIAAVTRRSMHCNPPFCSAKCLRPEPSCIHAIIPPASLRLTEGALGVQSSPATTFYACISAQERSASHGRINTAIMLVKHHELFLHKGALSVNKAASICMASHAAPSPLPHWLSTRPAARSLLDVQRSSRPRARRPRAPQPRQAASLPAHTRRSRGAR